MAKRSPFSLLLILGNRFTSVPGKAGESWLTVTVGPSVLLGLTTLVLSQAVSPYSSSQETKVLPFLSRYADDSLRFVSVRFATVTDDEVTKAESAGLASAIPGFITRSEVATSAIQNRLALSIFSSPKSFLKATPTKRLTKHEASVGLSRERIP